MEYQSENIQEIGARIELTRFTAGEVTELHAMLHVEPRNEIFESQLFRIECAQAKLMAMDEVKGAKIVFKRYFLSDATNQVPRIEENDPCTVSYIQQPPLDGSKIALWLYLQTGTDISADFATQFYTFENYSFPDKSLMIGDDGGEERRGIVQCDSVEVRLYFNSYYGDANNPMKIEVRELDAEKIFREDTTYFTDTDLSSYLADKAPLSSRVFTPMDYNLTSTVLNSSTHTHNVHIALDKSFGQHIMESYYDNPSNFQDSYHFIRNVFPGLYFHTTSGRGTMLSLYVGTCNVYFHYGDKDKDTTYVGLARFAATPEVIQCTRFVNGDMSTLIDDHSCTYLKTPAGICTEMTLPIDEVFGSEHATDSISMASVTLTRYNKAQDSYQLGTPSELLMVRKQDYAVFFRENRIADNRTSYTTTFNSTYNTYTFDNICRLLSYCKHEKASLAAAAGLSEEQWASENPDWNKVLLIPVVTSSVQKTVNGVSTQVQASVNHDMSLNSVKLVGGDTKIDMQVVFSRFQ